MKLTERDLVTAMDVLEDYDPFEEADDKFKLALAREAVHYANELLPEDSPGEKLEELANALFSAVANGMALALVASREGSWREEKRL